MIIGATPETDRHIMRPDRRTLPKIRACRARVLLGLSAGGGGPPPAGAGTQPPPLLREHRLYQADWLLRYYHFSAQELLTEEEPNFDPYLDPKCTWAVRHPEFFPVEVNTAGKEEAAAGAGHRP